MASPNLVGFVYNSLLSDAAELVDTIVKSLSLGKRSWVSSAAAVDDMREHLSGTSVVVVAGGDGTILRTVRVVAPFAVPIVGINLGRVGFMTELSVEEAAEKLPRYLNASLRIEERMMLQASVHSGPEGKPRLTLHALNDVVLGRETVTRLLDIDASVNGVPLTTYRADAVIVSTATGSTGYALSAGGAIIHPEARVMLVKPVAAHTGLRDGLILPEESVIELRARAGGQVLLSVDGAVDGSMGVDDRVTITSSPYTARFMRADPPSAFYATLTRRLSLVYRSGPSDAGH